MSRFLSLFALLVCCLIFSSCSKNPVALELATMDSTIISTLKGLNLSEVNTKISSAKTNKEKGTVMGALATDIEERMKILSAFQPKTPEVKKLSDDMTSALKTMAEGAKDAEQAINKEDASKLNSANMKFASGQNKLKLCSMQFNKTAKDNGYKSIPAK
jgi:hypothetical protein